MKVFHTYSNPSGFIWKELLYVQYLSAILAKKHYGEIEFYGDKDTAKQVSLLGLPYSNVHAHLLKDSDAETFSIPKLKVYGDMKDEFLHIDTDTLLFNKIDFKSYDKDYLFAYSDLGNTVNTKRPTIENLYKSWFFSMENHKDFNFKTKYPFREFTSKFKGNVPENILSSGREAYNQFFVHNTIYTRLFFDLIESIGDDLVSNFHMDSVPNMNVIYVKNHEKFRKVVSETLEHYKENKYRIDKEQFGACYIEQFMLHTQLRFIDKKYNKTSKKSKNFIFPINPLVVNQEDEGTPRQFEPNYPLTIQYLNQDHFSCSCCDETIISKLSRIREEKKFKEIVLNNQSEIINHFDENFNGYLHLSYLKWYAPIQALVIHKLRQEVGDDRIRIIHRYFERYSLQHKLDSEIMSNGEKLYEELTGFKFKPDVL